MLHGNMKMDGEFMCRYTSLDVLLVLNILVLTLRNVLEVVSGACEN